MVLRGKRVVKKTYVRRKLPVNVVGSPELLLLAMDGGFSEEGSPILVDDEVSFLEQGEEGTPAISL